MHEAYDHLSLAAAEAVEGMTALAAMLPPTVAQRLLRLAYALRDAQNAADRVGGVD